MMLSAARRVEAGGLVFSVPDTTPRAIVDASAHAHMTGTADALADLLAREPLRRQAGLSIDPATVKGEAEGDLALDLKLGKTARPEDTQFHASGALTNLELDKFLADESLNSATATFDADRNTLKIVGRRRGLGRRDPYRGRPGAGRGRPGDSDLRARRRRARQARPQLRLVADRLAAGQAESAAVARQRRGRDRPHQAGVDNPVPGVSKPAGKPGKATFLVKPAPEGASLSNIVVDLGAAAMRGSAELGADGAIQSAKITQARISPGDNFVVDVSNGPTALKASVRGTTLDARAVRQIAVRGRRGGPIRGQRPRHRRERRQRRRGEQEAISGLDLTAFRRGGEDPARHSCVDASAQAR